MGQYKDLLENILKEELNPEQQEALNKVKSGIPGSFRKSVPPEFRKKKVVAPVSTPEVAPVATEPKIKKPGVSATPAIYNAVRNRVR